ncbi:MAG: hypothetical protein O3B65_03000 [Chloroflexi bacterium]|nr:hypothetical protein [Chloroflexota bacterium]
MTIFRTARTSLAVGTSAYVAGDALGAQQSLSVPDRGIIRSIVITDVDDEATVDIRVWFFESAPTVIAANAAFALADADLELVQAVVDLNKTDDAHQYDAINGQAKYRSGLAIPYMTNGGLLWLQCECESGTPTFTATTDVKIQLLIEH